MASLNEIFKTGNSVINNLPVGSVLTVVGQGQLQVNSLGSTEVFPGDRINTKYGPATVVKPSSRFSYIDGFDPDDQVLYIADNTTVVRAISKSEL